MSNPITLYDETTPTWLRTICPVETPLEMYRRIQREIKKAEEQKKYLIEVHRERIEAIDDRLMFLMDQNLRAIEAVEASGDEI
jgi:hypothetical protein